MNVLLDTNILTRAAESSHPHHQSATDAVSLLMSRQETLCLVPQNLYEFWVVCTRPASENGLGMTAPIAERHLGDLKGAFELLDETPAFRGQGCGAHSPPELP